MLDAGWIEDVVPKPLRWRGSKYVISSKGLRVIGMTGEARRSVAALTPSEVGIP